MTSTAAERRVPVHPPMSERPAYGLLVGTAAVGGLLVQRLAGTGVDPVAYADALIPLLGGLVPVALLAAGLLSAVRPVRLRAGLR